MSSVSAGSAIVGAAAASFKPFNALAKIAGKIAGGLVGVFKRMDSQPSSARPDYGVRFKAHAQPGTTVGDYRVLGDKAKGVEPGFTALKNWHADDNDNVLQSGHPFHAEGKQWVVEQMRSGIGAERLTVRRAMQEAIDMLARPGSTNASQTALLKGMQDPKKSPLNFVICPDTKLVDEIATLTLMILAEERDSDEGAVAHDSLKQHLMESQPHFTEKHYIKLDYYQANKSLTGKYTIPYAKTKSLGGIPVLGNLMHKLGKSISPREINQGAVNEKVANDLMGVLGMNTQVLDLITTRHADGTPKLMLDSTHIAGFNDFDGEKDAAKGSVYIKDGVLVKNSRLPSDAPGAFNGPPQLHLDIQDLGDKKVMLLLLADRDALGSKGGNKGFVENQFFAIDPGHALEPTLLSKRGDVHSDLSFDPASSLASKDYKNFSIFDQSTFAQKMEGVRRLQQLQGEDSELFDDYAAQYGPESGSATLNFRAQLLETKAQYIGRRDDILNTFASRLDVDNYHFGDAIDSDPQLKRQCRDQTLNLLDGLEKLTSTTVSTAKGKPNGIGLIIPHVQKPEDRKAWDVQQNGGNIVFTFQGNRAEAQKMLATLTDYSARPAGLALPAFVTDGAGTITLSVPTSQIQAAQSALSYSNIMQYKHG